MEILGIGPLELVFILIIILLVAGPKDIAGTARNLGKGLNRLYKSPNYQIIRKASQEIRNLPARLAREAQLEELEELKVAQKELEEAANSIGDSAVKPFQAWVEDVKGSGPGVPPGKTAPPSPPRTSNGPAPHEPANGQAQPTSSRPTAGAPETPPNTPQEPTGHEGDARPSA